MAKGDEFTQTKTIDYVKPGEREWKPQDGPPVFFITALFSDGSTGDVGCKQDKIGEVRASLEALIGQPSSFDLKDNGEYQNTQQFKIKTWPGKPQGISSGGGGGGRGGGMSNTQVAYLAASNVLTFNQEKSFEGIAGEVDTLAKLILEKMNGAVATESKEQLPADERATMAQIRELRDLAFELGMTADTVKDTIGVTDLAELSKDDAVIFVESWKQKLAEKALAK